ncbi:exo-beta-1,4-galactosidase [Mucilaginibacter arboris]|uniref:beta-galactosidase n=1 Tax=Mucilaginibacter arboris TaxID=2682090 RepID=A0A7K1SU28_9SPHI|nr:sugar-binding domain-containing protein [Mucilaginibacter arboris]MVN20815.1 beta-glucuronidase [Mucilaginibacter arboris]
MQLKLNRLLKWYAGILLALLLFSAFTDEQTISLTGTWRFKTDPQDVGIQQKWFNRTLDETIKLPGSMAENGKGDDITLKTKWTGSIYDSSWYFNPHLAKYRQPGNIKIPFWLTPAKHYVGAAWYQKDVTISKDWKGRHITLYLEYAHTETRVWVDDQEIGMQNSLVSPHIYDLTQYLSPGKHTISIRIDNRIKEINVGPDSHSITDHTQGNWNGIVGKMALTAGSQVYLDDIQVYPDLKNKLARIKISIKSDVKTASSGWLNISAKSFNTKTIQQIKMVKGEYKLENGEGTAEIVLPMGAHFLTWDEFNPALYRLTVQLVSRNGSEQTKQVQFGMREFKAVGRHFEMNGRPVFLRGTVNNCEFPLTGYPSMDVPAWTRIFKIARVHGLNHMRFHSFCPPEAAFIAADLAGFYLQPEGPTWANHGTSIGDGKPIDQYIYDETNRMAKFYGNYASFCMMAYGNEPRGKQVEFLTKFVDYWKAKDSRHLYTGASVGGSWPVIPNNEYMVRAGARGLAWDKRPESESDYASQIASFTVPFVAHEMGQYCAFPDFKEIKNYTGVYRAKNFELFQEDLQDHHMGDEAEKFLMASGKLQALCYKNEIEKALRTPNYSGFELLSLNDYPGQGTALVGVLNAFWNEKGYITPKQFSRFCNSTVPLARIPKFVFSNNESFKAAVEIAHFGAAPLTNAHTSWKITDKKGIVLAKGSFEPKTIQIGNNISLGEVNFPLSNITKATALDLEVMVNNTSFANDWDFWVYPAKLPEAKSDNIYYCTTLDDKAKETLDKGGKVFLEAAGKVVKGKEIVQTFLPVFWNTSWFKMRPPHTLGILLDQNHPAFKDFPTSFHSDLQWWEIVNKAQVMHLEDFPPGFRPLVQPIDTWFLNRRLGLIMEAKVGNGKLLVSSADLTSDPENRPAARQLYYSLQKYMASDQFNPKTSVDFNVVKDVFETASHEVFSTYTKDSPDELKSKPEQKKST